MTMWETAREYLKAKKKEIAPGYFEVPYKEYRPDGLIIEGTEDFSRERLKSLEVRWIHTPTGKKNKGGYNVWKREGVIWTLDAKAARRIALIKYGPGVTLRK